ADGAEAVRIFAEKSQSIQLVITDLVMPGGMSGTQLAGILKKQKADLPIIFSSGYNGENILHDIKLTEGVNFLAKPYNLATMAKVIRDRLDAQPG
ncbi:MAG: response regulator, partial [Turneriella sp.]